MLFGRQRLHGRKGKGTEASKVEKNFQRWTTAANPGPILLTAEMEDTLFPGQSCLMMEPKMLDLESRALVPKTF